MQNLEKSNEKKNSKTKHFLSILSYTLILNMEYIKTLRFHFLWWVETVEEDYVIKNDTTNKFSFYYLFSFREVS